MKRRLATSSVLVAPLLILLIVAAALAVGACGKVSTTSGSAASPSRAASPSARGPGTIAYTKGGDYVCLINTNGTGFKRLAKGWRPAWSPDGSQIAYLAGCNLMVMNADGSGQHLVRTFAFDQPARSVPAWSPDGRQLAITDDMRPPLDYWHLVVMNSDGTDYRDVAPLGWGISGRGSIAWAPDGRIFFLRWDKGVHEICSVKPDGSDLAVVTPVAVFSSALSLSPDGVWLALYERDAHRLVRLLASGHGRETRFVQRLSRYPVLQQAASSWSPHGTRIALAESPSGWSPGSALYIVDAAEGSIRRVPHTGEVFDPSWRPQ